MLSKIAVTGKGGGGKTTLCALIIKWMVNTWIVNPLVASPLQTTNQSVCRKFREKPEIEEKEWTLVKAALKQALDQVNKFRLQEGKSLDSDLRQRVDAINGKLEKVERYEKERIVLVRERIGKHLEDLGMKDAVDENRFEQELIYYIEKLDISEEKVRLANHCLYFLETLEDQAPAGKKLGFISQEMGREINTLGSKANHKELQKLVVEMKDELERIKEQILNVL